MKKRNHPKYKLLGKWRRTYRICIGMLLMSWVTMTLLTWQLVKNLKDNPTVLLVVASIFGMGSSIYFSARLLKQDVFMQMTEEEIAKEMEEELYNRFKNRADGIKDKVAAEIFKDPRRAN